MNSEELEQSLRTEFEQHLKLVFADVQREISDLHEQVEQEFERHKSQLAAAFQSFSERAVSSDINLDAGFRESVVEHLRLARDEGARITATAIAEAEAMEAEAAETAAAEAAAVPVVTTVVSSVGVAELHDSINDICGQNSQAAILKSLVAHAGQFTPRGAFFIVKNEHLVGWRVFGREEAQMNVDSSQVREIFFPVADETALGASLKALSAVKSSYGDYSGDSAFLDKLEFGEPEQIVAIPLVARGRGVAVLYADRGANGEEIDVQALETLVRVAGLTVEVLAAASSASSARQAPAADLGQASNLNEASAPIEPQPSSDENEHQTDEQQASASENAYGYDAAAETVEVAESVESAEESNYQSQTYNDAYKSENGNESEAAMQSNEQSNDYSSADYPATDYAAAEYSTEFETPIVQAEEIQTEEVESEAQSENFQPVYQTESESYSWSQPAAENSDAEASAESVDYSSVENVETSADYQFQFEGNQSYESSENQPDEAPAFKSLEDFDAAQLGAPSLTDEPARQETEDYASPVAVENGAYNSSLEMSGNGATAMPIADGGFDSSVIEPAAAVSKPARSRFSDRNIDLPVEVSEDERRLHNDARRFARLLVSEIKLYNEQKVKEGRDENDLYDRLREAIDRSREMYDKRVQPPVAAKFDYFHYELVNSLAEGVETKLGESYVGAVA